MRTSATRSAREGPGDSPGARRPVELSAANGAYRSSSTSSSPATYARASPTSSGAHTSRRIAWGDRMMTSGASSGPASVPSQALSRTGNGSTPRIGARAVASCSATVVFSAICASCVTR